MSRPAIRFHEFPLSGHSHRVAQMLAMLELPVERVPVNLAAGDQRRPEFLALNRFAQVPVIEDGDVVVADSNAILVYLAKRYGAGTGWLPEDPVGAARVQRWLSAAAGPVAFGPAAARIAALFGGAVDAKAAIERAHRLLAVMEGELAGRDFLAADHPTIADLACHAYVAHAPEGHVSLADYPHVRAWIARVEALPRFVPMAKSEPRTAAPA